MTHAEAGKRGGLARAITTTHDQRVAWGYLGKDCGIRGGRPHELTISELRLLSKVEEKKEEKLPGSLRELKQAWREKVAGAS